MGLIQRIKAGAKTGWHELVTSSDQGELEQVYELAITAVAIWREARGEPFLAKVGVGEVIRNRVNDTRWPDNWRDVILQPSQFSSFTAGDPNAVAFPETRDATFAECLKAAAMVFDKDQPSMMSQANHFHAYRDGHPSWPSWATSEREVGRSGKTKFYKL